MKRLNQSGSSAFELIVLLAVLAIVATTGVLVFNRRNSPAATTSATATTKQASVSSAPAVNSASDLNKASATLDQNDPGSANSSDSAQLNSQLAGY